MLETIREFGLEQLAASGDWEQRTGDWREWFLTLAETGYSVLLGPEHRQWLARLDADLDNMRAALGWALDPGRGRAGPAAGLRAFPLLVRARAPERRAAVGGAGAGERRETPTRGSPRRGTGRHRYLTWARGDERRSAELWAEAIPLIRQLGDLSQLALALHAAGLAEDRGDHERAQATAGGGARALPNVGRHVLSMSAQHALRAWGLWSTDSMGTSTRRRRTSSRRCTGSRSWATPLARAWRSPTAGESPATGGRLRAGGRAHTESLRCTGTMATAGGSRMPQRVGHRRGAGWPG